MSKSKTKKKVDPAVSAEMSRIGKKSWEARKARILAKAEKKKSTKE